MFAVFDTEGTRYTAADGKKFAVLYNWDLLALTNEKLAPKVTKDNVGKYTTRYEGRDCATLYTQLSRLLNHHSTVKIAIHNLSYDYAYLRQWLKMIQCAGYEVEVTARSSTNILKISVIKRVGKSRYEKLLFFDTLAIFAKSLRNLGESLGYEKEHIDYLEDIAPDTKYTEANKSYNHRDTDLLMVAICSSLCKQPGVTLDRLGSKILTKTSIVRVVDREDKHIGGMVVGTRQTKQGKKKLTLYDLDRLFVTDHQISSLDLMRTWSSYGSTQNGTPGCYAGGVNLSNTKHIGQIIHDVMSYDFTSAYPGVLVSMSVPISPSEVLNPEPYNDLLTPATPSIEDVLAGVSPFWVGTVKFTNVNMKPLWSSHVSDASITEAMVTQHRAENVGIVFEDGHLHHADALYLTICNPSFYEFCTEFDFESAEFVNLYIYKGYALPTPYMVVRTVHHYREKTVAKELGKAILSGSISADKIDAALDAGYISVDEADRLKSTPDEAWVKSFIQGHKGNLNALYGVMVTAPLRESYILNGDEWLTKVDEPDEKLWEDYCKANGERLMWREAGVMVALLNRYKIVHMIDAVIHAGGEVLYTDTDSIKVIGMTKDAVDSVFEPIHEGIERRTRYVVETVLGDLNACIAASNEANGYDTPPVPIPDDPAFRKLGKLDYEGTYPEFVTMGHKKYAITHPSKRWSFACSGYKLSVLDEVCASMLSVGVPENVVPLCVLGYDVRYDSPTGIASLQITTPETWREVEMEAEDVTGDPSHRHTYKGYTCPGFSIYDAGKIMNHTDSLMNGARFNAAARNNPDIMQGYRLDVSRDDAGRIVWGRRGTVRMAWKAWDIPDSAWEESKIF